MAAPSKPIDASNPTAKTNAAGDRPLRAIADELRRIGDLLAAQPTLHVAAVPEEIADVEPEPEASPREEALFQALRAWRAEEARKLGMPPYIVATDRVLRAVARTRPATVEGLREIPGFGPSKTAKYGSDVVGLVAASA